MIRCSWPRLGELLPFVDTAERVRLAEILGLPTREPRLRDLIALLAEERIVRKMIRTLSDRATLGLKRAIEGRGRPFSPETSYAKALVRAGLAYAAPGGLVFPLEFAFADEEILPEETLLRLIARGRLEDLLHWRGGLLALLGLRDEDIPSTALLCAADLYALLTAHADALVASLDVTALTALEEFGRADGLAGRRAWLERHGPCPQGEDGPLLPYKMPAGCPPVVRELLLRGLVASSGAAWQPGIYLHIPLELRPVALAGYYTRQADAARRIISSAREEDYRPAGSRVSTDGQALVCRTAAALACVPLRLTQAGHPVQADLERLARALDVPARQAEAMLRFIRGLGLVEAENGLLAPPYREDWHAVPLPTGRALSWQATRLSTGEPPTGPDQDFLSFLRRAILEALDQAEIWLPLRHLQELVSIRPGSGRWLEYYWGNDAPGEGFSAAVAASAEVLSHLGAAEIEPAGPDRVRAARITPWGHDLLGEEITLAWPPPGPLVVTASHEVFVPLGMGPKTLARLGHLADLTSTGPTMAFRLTRETLWRAAANGVRIEEELSWLEAHSRDGLPENVRLTLAEAAARQGEVRLAPAGGFLEVREAEMMATVRRHPALAARIVAESGNLLVVSAGTDLKALARELRRAGLLVEEAPERMTVKKGAKRPGGKHLTPNPFPKGKGSK